MDNNKLEIILIRVEDLINNDILNHIELDNCNINDMKDSLTILLESTYIIEKIKYELDFIITDSKININDIPNIINIILDSKDLIYEYETLLKIKINKITLKYYIFGILYYILIENNIIHDNDIKMIDYFELMWKFISFEIEVITIIETPYIKLVNSCLSGLYKFKNLFIKL